MRIITGILTFLVGLSLGVFFLFAYQTNFGQVRSMVDSFTGVKASTPKATANSIDDKKCLRLKGVNGINENDSKGLTSYLVGDELDIIMVRAPIRGYSNTVADAFATGFLEKFTSDRKAFTDTGVKAIVFTDGIRMWSYDFATGATTREGL